MDDFQTQLKIAKDLYLDLGVALGKLTQATPSKPHFNRSNECKERVKNAMNNRANQVINFYQMHEILNQEYSLKACGDALRHLAKEGFLEKIGQGTYKKEMI